MDTNSLDKKVYPEFDAYVGDKNTSIRFYCAVDVLGYSNDLKFYWISNSSTILMEIPTDPGIINSVIYLL